MPLKTNLLSEKNYDREAVIHCMEEICDDYQSVCDDMFTMICFIKGREKN